MMSDTRDDKDNDPDYEPEFSTLNMSDLIKCRVVDKDIGNNVSIGENPSPHTFRPSGRLTKPKKNRRTSLIWTKFTIINKKAQLAACNICDKQFSFRSTSGNLKKHLENKHGFSIKSGVLPFKRATQPNYIAPTPKPKVSELAGVSDKGITVKVVGENGEEHFQLIGQEFLSEEVVHDEVQGHEYNTQNSQTITVGEEVGTKELRIGRVESLGKLQSPQLRQAPFGLYTPRETNSLHLDKVKKRQRIMELQMECLEIKKYNMQLEALAMEQQLNLPRSIFTEPLHYADTQTRGTQTDVGGSDTKVFYITDKRGGQPLRQLFAFQDLDF